MISIPGDKLDFGDMKLNKSYTKDFKIKNLSDKPLEVKSLGQSCTCTKVSMTSKTIPPKGEGAIHVTVTPGSTGNFLRSFWFVADSTHTIKLIGKVT